MWLDHDVHIFLWGVHSTRRLVWLGDAIAKISGFLASGSLTYLIYLSNMEKKVRTSVHPQVLVDKSSINQVELNYN
jgi:hypothetical protein